MSLVYAIHSNIRETIGVRRLIGCKAGLVFVTAFSSRKAMRGFLAQISWETEVWVAEDPDHLIHFDGERFLGPYPDVLPLSS